MDNTLGLTFSQHITNLTRTSYFQLRRLRAIRKYASTPIFTSIVHAFDYFRIDYCNSLLAAIPKIRLSPSSLYLMLQLVLLTDFVVISMSLLMLRKTSNPPLAYNLFSHRI